MTTEQLYNKKTELFRLKKIQSSTFKTKLSPMTIESESPNSQKDKFTKQKTLLLNIISQKIQVTEDNIDNLEKLLNRDKIIEQTKRIFFNEWKYKSGMSHIEKSSHVDARKSLVASVPVQNAPPETNIELEERQYTIDELERWLTLLQKTFCETECELSPKPSKSGLFSNSSSSDGLHSEDSKADNLFLGVSSNV
jgi:hypothetical protein